jgi:hypothetical protein
VLYVENGGDRTFFAEPSSDRLSDPRWPNSLRTSIGRYTGV